MCAESLPLGLTLCDTMDGSLPGSSVLGILQARILVGYHTLLQGIFLIQGLNLRLLYLPALADGCFTTSTIWEAQSNRYHW